MSQLKRTADVGAGSAAAAAAHAQNQHAKHAYAKRMVARNMNVSTQAAAGMEPDTPIVVGIPVEKRFLSFKMRPGAFATRVFRLFSARALGDYRLPRLGR
jgi:hypothetical protein